MEHFSVGIDAIDNMLKANKVTKIGSFHDSQITAVKKRFALATFMWMQASMLIQLSVYIVNCADTHASMI